MSGSYDFIQGMLRELEREGFRKRKPYELTRKSKSYYFRVTGSECNDYTIISTMMFHLQSLWKENMKYFISILMKKRIMTHFQTFLDFFLLIDKVTLHFRGAVSDKHFSRFSSLMHFLCYPKTPSQSI